MLDRHTCNGAVASATRADALATGRAEVVARCLPPGPRPGPSDEGLKPAEIGNDMRAIVTCECCGHRQTVARPIRRPEAFFVGCHECERSLRAEVSAGDIRAAETAITRTPSRIA